MQTQILLDDRIIIENAVEDEMKTEGGIFLSSQNNDWSKGKVILTGTRRIINNVAYPLTVKVGDTVRFNSRAATSVVIGNKLCLAVKEADILMIIDRPKSNKNED